MLNSHLLNLVQFLLDLIHMAVFVLEYPSKICRVALSPTSAANLTALL